MDGDRLLDVLRARATGPSLAEEVAALEHQPGPGAVRRLRARHRSVVVAADARALRAEAAERCEEALALAAESRQALRRASAARGASPLDR